MSYLLSDTNNSSCREQCFNVSKWFCTVLIIQRFSSWSQCSDFGPMASIWMVSAGFSSSSWMRLYKMPSLILHTSSFLFCLGTGSLWHEKCQVVFSVSSVYMAGSNFTRGRKMSLWILKKNSEEKMCSVSSGNFLWLLSTVWPGQIRHVVTKFDLPVWNLVKFHHLDFQASFYNFLYYKMNLQYVHIGMFETVFLYFTQWPCWHSGWQEAYL